MRLALTEKPSVAFDIARGLGKRVEKKNGYLVVGDTVVTWCYGHLLEVDDSILPKEWKLQDLQRSRQESPLFKAGMN